MKIFLILTLFISCGCATLKSWVGMGEKEPAPVQKLSPTIDGPRFSETQNMLVPSQRQYKRMTKSRMEDESELHSQAGSMWVMEGQGAYLFAQNKTRREGDLLNVKVEGAAQKQVEVKVGVIKKLLKQLEEEQKLKEQKDLESQQPKTQMADGGKPSVPEPVRAPASAEQNKKDDETINLEIVPTRIVEKLPDGNYRVKGAQPFMIGKREFKVIVTGLIRPEDFNDQGISSNQLLDPQFDVVSLRKKEM